MTRARNPCRHRDELDRALNILENADCISEAGRFSRDEYETALCRIAAEFEAENLIRGFTGKSLEDTKPFQGLSVALTALCSVGNVSGLNELLTDTDDAALHTKSFAGYPLFAAVSALLKRGARWNAQLKPRVGRLSTGSHPSLDAIDLGRVATAKGDMWSSFRS
jgi:hypothetical protein